MEFFFISYEYKCPIYLLLVVGDDAAYKVGVGVAEGGHQLGQLLLVELGHGAEHTLPGAGTEHRVTARRCSHTHNLSWNTHTCRCQIIH